MNTQKIYMWFRNEARTDIASDEIQLYGTRESIYGLFLNRDKAEHARIKNWGSGEIREVEIKVSSPMSVGDPIYACQEICECSVLDEMYCNHSFFQNIEDMNSYILDAWKERNGVDDANSEPIEFNSLFTVGEYKLK